MFASILLTFVMVAQTNRGQDNFNYPGTSTLAFGAVDGHHLLLTQTVRDEVQWYWADLRGVA